MSIEIAPGIILVQLKHSPNWYVRGKNANGKWYQTSTNTTDLERAKQAAFLIAGKNSVTTPTPKHQFKKYMDKVEQDFILEDKPITQSYLRAIRKYIRPYWDDIPVDQITNAHLLSFYAKHKDLSATTWGFLNIVLRRTFRHITDTTQLSMPNLKVKVGQKPKVRPGFTLEEYRKLWRASRKWIRQSPTMLEHHKRQLLHFNILLIANSGIRPGRECRSLRWKDVKIYDNYAELLVREGKRGGGPFIVRKNFLPQLEKLRGLTGQHEFLFSLWNGEPMEHESIWFNKFVRHNPEFEGKTLYDLRHMAITLFLYKGIPPHVIAKQVRSSIAMISDHYSKIEPYRYVDRFNLPAIISQL